MRATRLDEGDALPVGWARVDGVIICAACASPDELNRHSAPSRDARCYRCGDMVHHTQLVAGTCRLCLSSA